MKTPNAKKRIEMSSNLLFLEAYKYLLLVAQVPKPDISSVIKNMSRQRYKRLEAMINKK